MIERSDTVISPEKKLAYENLCEVVPDAISILARSVHTKGTAQVEKTGSYTDKELNGWISGSRARVAAADELHAAFPSSKIITNSTVTRTGEEHARITAQELIRRGVREEDIIRQSESFNTYTEILELVRLCVEQGWHSTAVVVNEYQMERAQAFWENIGRLDDPQSYWQKPHISIALDALKGGYALKMTFVSAEDVLPHMGRRYAGLVLRAKDLPEYQAAVQEDVRSAKEVREGRYWGRPFRQ